MNYMYKYFGLKSFKWFPCEVLFPDWMEIWRCQFFSGGKLVGVRREPTAYSTHIFSLQMPLASRCQKHNAQAYHHLVCEQHFFLRTLCLADSTAKEDKKRKKLKKLLCESAANLAELFARSVLVRML